MQRQAVRAAVPGGSRRTAAAPRSQRRSYLNLYPKPDAETQDGVQNMTAYYQLPDYVQHRDHKQRRPVALDKTNTTDMTREEERIQRIKVMNWRDRMARKGRKASSVSEDLPAWEGAEAGTGVGRFSDTWSGAQLLERHVRRGTDLRRLDPDAELEAVDPNGAGNDLLAFYEATPPARPPSTTFHRLVDAQELRALSQRYASLAEGAVLPTTGLDFPAVAAGLSKALASACVSDAGAMTLFRKQKDFLADLVAATVQGMRRTSLLDDVFASLAVSTAVEGRLDPLSAEFSHRMQEGRAVSDAGLARLHEGFQRNEFWKTLAELPEVRPEYAQYVTAFAQLDAAGVRAAADRAAQLFERYAAIIDKLYAAQVAAGERPSRDVATDADWLAFVDTVIAGPYKTWFESGSLPFEAMCGSDPETTIKLEELFDTETVFGEVTFGEHLRWGGHLESVAVPLHLQDTLFVGTEADDAAAKDAADGAADAEFDVLAGDDDEAEAGEEKAADTGAAAGVTQVSSALRDAARHTVGFNPRAALAARFCNLSMAGAFASLAEDAGGHMKFVHAALHTNPKETMSFFQFLRCLTNCTNIRHYNSSQSRAAFAASVASARFARGGGARLLAGSDVALGRGVYDAAAAAAEIFYPHPGRDWTGAVGAARESCRRESQASLQLLATRRAKVRAQERRRALVQARDVVEDVDACIGLLRRRLAAERNADKKAKRAADGLDVRDVSVAACPASGKKPTTLYTGCPAVVSWAWKPTAEYGIQVADAEKKARAYTALLASQQSAADSLDKPGAIVTEVLDKAGTYSEGKPMPRSDRLDWAFTKMFHKWARHNDEVQAVGAVNIEKDHQVHVALYKKSNVAQEFVARRKRVEESTAAVEVGDVSEEARLREVLRHVREWVVESYVERISHALGVDEVDADMLSSIHAGDLKMMLESTDFLTEEFLEKSDSLWDYHCDLAATPDSNFANTLSCRVRLPFVREGATIDSGVYRVGVTGLDADGTWASTATSPEFEISNVADELVSGFLQNGRPGARPLGGPNRDLIPVEEMPQAVRYFKTHATHPVEFDLATETRFGSDHVVFDGKPYVHVNVLRAELCADMHRNEYAADPVNKQIASTRALQVAAYAARHPGHSAQELREAAPAFLEGLFGGDRNAGWLSLDEEMLHASLRQENVAESPVERFLDTKFASLFTDSENALGSVRYEGVGYVSELSLSSALPKMRAPLPPAGPQAAQGASAVDRVSGAQYTLAEAGGNVTVTVRPREGEETTHNVQSLSFDDVAWTVGLGDATLNLPRGVAGDQFLADAREFAFAVGEKTALKSEIPAEVPLQLHHYGDVAKGLINGAHTQHCGLSDAVRQTKLDHDAQRERLHPRHSSDVEEEAKLMPTLLKAWQDAGSEEAELGPIGLKQYRRRFDSWQLYSGTGRYDWSPTKDEQWKHPVEENPTQYRFVDTQQPFSSI